MLQRALSISCAGLTVVALLAACGQKGPLYLPEKPIAPPAAANSSAPQSAPASR